MQDPQQPIVELAGGDPFDAVLSESRAHQRAHGCGLFPAGPAVMQLASMFVRAAGCHTILDLGCGIGYSTFWLANANAEVKVTGIDADDGHVKLARAACTRLALNGGVSFIVGELLTFFSPSTAQSMLFMTTPGSRVGRHTWTQCSACYGRGAY